MQVGVSSQGTHIDLFLDTLYDLTHTSVHDSGLAFHPEIGYAFNKYFRLGLGYQSVAPYKSTSRFLGNYETIKYQQYYIDLAGKIILPFWKFGFFLKPGVAFVHRSAVKDNLIEDNNSLNAVKVTKNIHNAANRVTGLLGAGFLFNATQNLSFDLSATAYLPVQHISGTIVSGIGFAYRLP